MRRLISNCRRCSFCRRASLFPCSRSCRFTPSAKANFKRTHYRILRNIRNELRPIFIALASKELGGSHYGPHNHHGHSGNSEFTTARTFAEDEKHAPAGDNGITWKEYTGGTFAILTFIVSWYALRAASRNADAAKEAVNHAKTSTERQIRAYLSIDTITPDKIQKGMPFGFFFTPKNHGPTPAMRFSFRGFTFLGTFAESQYGIPNGDRGEWNEEFGDVFPGVTATPMNIHSDTKFFITDEHIRLMSAGTHAIVSLLEVRYVDVFGQKRYTEETLRFMRRGNALSVEMIPGTSRMT